MKQFIIVSVFCIACCSKTCAQWHYITDIPFRTFLTDWCAPCMSGPYINTQCADTFSNTVMEVSSIYGNYSINSLDGLQFFGNLTHLTFIGTNVSHLPDSLPSELVFLNCINNSLDSLPVLPVTLKVLNCNQNSIDALPLLPSSLVELYFDFNSVSTLPILPSGLKHLHFSENQISSIDSLPNKLVDLDCSLNNLTELPQLPDSLVNLNALSNQLSFLPELPDTLGSLVVSYNLIDSLPELPQQLIALLCGYNNIDSIPQLPSELKYLLCNNNNISVLPELPSGLMILDCSQNSIQSLPLLPSSLYSLTCSNNPISCFPALPNILETLIFDSTNIVCLPNIPNPDFELDGFSVCDPTNNSNGCILVSVAQGTIFQDVNANTTFDPSELPAQNVIVQIQPGGYTYSSNISGVYQAAVDSAVNYTLTIPNPPLYHTVTPASYTGIFPNSGMVSTGNDFALQPVPNVHDLRVELTAVNQPMPGFPLVYQLTYTNVGTVPQTATVQLVYSDSLLYDSTGTAPTSQLQTTLTWNVDTLNPLQQGSFAVYFTVPANVDLLGDTLFSVAGINPVANDTTPLDNVSELHQVVVGSYDPNDKQVLPTGDIAAGEQLTYTIRFQNTGTAAAQTVIIRDTLDDDLNIATLQQVATSHTATFDLQGRFATWYFFNINLPDSNTNEPASHGFVKYRVRSRNNLLVGESVSNTASIYFDFNPPIVTNTVVSTVGQLSGIAEQFVQSGMAVYPNPASNRITAEFQTADDHRQIQLLDQFGRVVLQQSATEIKSEFDVAALPAGLYVLQATSGEQRITRRVVVTH